VAHSSNPAARSAENLIKFIDFSPGLNRTEMFGLLKGSYESPSMSRTMSQQLLRHVLVFIAKTSAHKKYEDYWKELKNSFDQELCRQWRQAQSDRITRIKFVRANRLGLSLFVPMEVCTKVVTDVEAEKEPEASEVVQLQKCSSIGAELFSSEAMKVEMSEYVVSIDRRICELERLDFDLDEVSNFRALMLHAAENLDSEVYKEFDGTKTQVKFLDATVGQTLPIATTSGRTGSRRERRLWRYRMAKWKEQLGRKCCGATPATWRTWRGPCRCQILFCSIP